MTRIEDIKARWDIPTTWLKLGLPGDPKIGMNKSPFRDDRNPSLSIYSNGQKWKDHASDEGGDVIDFVQRALNCDSKEALAWFGGETDSTYRAPLPKPPKKPSFDWSPMEVKKWKDRYPTEQDLYVLDRWAEFKRLGPVDLFVEEGSLRIDGNKPVFVFQQGVKIRHDADSSRSNRWLTGGPPHNLWRVHSLCYRPRIVILVEGETDCMAMTNEIGLDKQTEVMGCPGAGWRPGYFIPAFKMALNRGLEMIVVAFDPDEAGVNGQNKVVAELQAAGLPAVGETSGCRGLDFSDLHTADRKSVIERIFSVA